MSRDTVEQEFALNRQLFLCEQGYAYRIADPEELGAAAGNGPLLPASAHLPQA